VLSTPSPQFNAARTRSASFLKGTDPRHPGSGSTIALAAPASKYDPIR